MKRRKEVGYNMRGQKGQRRLFGFELFCFILFFERKETEQREADRIGKAEV